MTDRPTLQAWLAELDPAIDLEPWQLDVAQWVLDGAPLELHIAPPSTGKRQAAEMIERLEDAGLLACLACGQHHPIERHKLNGVTVRTCPHVDRERGLTL